MSKQGTTVSNPQRKMTNEVQQSLNMNVQIKGQLNSTEKLQQVNRKKNQSVEPPKI